MGNKFSLGKKNKINVQQAIEQINKNESINYDDDDYLDDEKRLEEMISARYRDREEQDTIRERERENENAFNEIHVSFFKINIEKYLDFIDSYIKKPNSYYENLNLEEFIESKFFTFIDSNFDEELKDSSKYKLEKILQKLFESECYELQINKWRILIGKTLDYVFKQDDKFISAYI